MQKEELKEMCDCKVIVNEYVVKQHRMVVCKMALMVKKKKADKVKPKIRWWKLKETSCQEAFRKVVIRILGSKDGLPDEWDKTSEMLRKTDKIVCYQPNSVCVSHTQLAFPHLQMNANFYICIYYILSFFSCMTS